MVAEFRRVVAEHGLRPSNPHPFLLEPADQAEQLAVTLEGVTAQVAARGEKREKNRWDQCPLMTPFGTIRADFHYCLLIGSHHTGKSCWNYVYHCSC